MGVVIMKKKLLSVLLCVCMAMGLLPTTALATSKTADDAIAWARSQVGHSVGYDDGSGYYQCVEFIQAYYQWLGAGTPSGNGADYATNALPSGWTRTPGGIPQKGDILVYSRYSDTVQQHGHVAIYESDNVLYDQDGSVCGATVKREEKNYRTYTYNYWGCIHPNFASAPTQPAVTPLNIGEDFHATIYYPHGGKLVRAEDINDSSRTNVQIYGSQWAAVDSDDPKDIWHFIRQDNGSYKIINEWCGWCLDVYGGVAKDGANIGTWYDDHGDDPERWFVAIAPGSDDKWYSLVSAVDFSYVMDVQWADTYSGANVQLYTTDWSSGNLAQQFNIVKKDNYQKPAEPGVPEIMSIFADGDTVLVSWDRVPTVSNYDDRAYEVNIYNTATGKYVVSGERVAGTSYTCTLPEGNYRAEVRAVNTRYANYTSVWASKNFDVENRTAHHVLTTSGSDLGGSVTIQPATAKQGETVTVTATARSGYVFDTITAEAANGAAVWLTALGGGSYTFTMPDSNVTLDVAFKAAQEDWVNPFSDVVEGAWYYEAVKFVNQSGLMNGSDGKFDHSGNLSRAMIAQILYNKENCPEVPDDQVFSDVPRTAWYFDAVSWAAEQGIVRGYEDGSFAPDASITREQLAAVLWRYAGSPVSGGGTLNFTDANRVGSWALDAVKWAVESGIISGKGGGILDPQGPATRAQVAQMLKNYLDK